MFSEIIRDIISKRIELIDAINSNNNNLITTITNQIKSLYNELPPEDREEVKNTSSEDLLSEIINPIKFKTILIENVSARQDKKVYTPENIGSLIKVIKTNSNKVKISLLYKDKEETFDSWVFQNSLYNEFGQKLFSDKLLFNTSDIESVLKSNIEGYLYQLNISLKIKSTDFEISDNFPEVPISLLNQNEAEYEADSYLSNNSTEKEKYKYDITINSITPQYLLIDETFCYLSPIIKSSTETSIKLISTFEITDFSSIEFSIEDEIGSHPIMLENETKVTNEKLFMGLDTRFPIKDYKIKMKDTGEIIAIDLKDALLHYEKYMIDYTVDGTYDSYIPKGEYKIKVIVRFNKVYDYEINHNHIKNISIKKFIGEEI